MFEGLVALVKASRTVQFALVFVAGGAIASVLYPTKHIEEKLQKTFELQVSTLKQQHQQELTTEHDEYLKTASEYQAYHDESERKINSLSTQVTSLKSHQKKNYYKIVHTDGTVEVRISDERDTSEQQKVSQQVQEEYKQKLDSEIAKLSEVHSSQVTSMQKEWDSKEQDYRQQISTLTQSKVTDINPKSFTLDGGMLTNLDYYGHVTYNIFGPFVLGLQSQFGPAPAAGAGIGLRF